MKCPACGAPGDGNYCAQCGAALDGGDAGPRCPACGLEAAPDALFCAECGEPLRDPEPKSAGDRLPWVLSGLALVAFAVGITLLVQESSAPRSPGSPPTGSVISGGGGRMEAPGPGDGAAPTGGRAGAPAAGSPGEPREGGMPTARELASMPPREAADRLFERAMRLAEAGGGDDRAAFFARMGIRAYRRVPASQADADLRFHVGLLELVRGGAPAARAHADTLLREQPGHLLGLLLAARAAGAAGDSAAAGQWRDSLRAAARATSLDARPEYRAHRTLLEAALEGGT